MVASHAPPPHTHTHTHTHEHQTLCTSTQPIYTVVRRIFTHFYHVFVGNLSPSPSTDMPPSEAPKQINPSLPPLPPTTIQEYSHRKEEHICTRIRRILEIRRKNNSDLFFCFAFGFSSPVVQRCLSGSSPTYHRWTMFRGATDGAGFSSSLISL